MPAHPGPEWRAEMNEGQIYAMLVMLAIFLICMLVVKVIDVLDPRTPEQRKEDERRAELLAMKRQWCDKLGGPCRRIKNRKVPYHYCFSKCADHAMCSRGYRRRVTFEEVYGNPFDQK